MTFENEIREIVAGAEKDPRIGSIGGLYVGGSISYGLADKNSDIDIRGFFVQSGTDIIQQNECDQVQIGENDCVIYSLKKFLSLLCNCNPNVIECLGLLDEHILIDTELFSELRDNVDRIISKKAIMTFGGYANGMLNKIRIGKFSDARHHAKACSHCLRIMRMGTEVLQHGVVKTNRDAERNLLCNVKNGVFTIDNGDGTFSACEPFYNLYSEINEKFHYAASMTKLPDDADREWCRGLLVKANEEEVKKIL